jgi:hypothetical protein
MADDSLEKRYNALATPQVKAEYARKKAANPEPDEMTIERSDNGRHIITHNYNGDGKKPGRTETHAVEPTGLVGHVKNAFNAVVEATRQDKPIGPDTGSPLAGIVVKKKAMDEYKQAYPDKD